MADKSRKTLTEDFFWLTEPAPDWNEWNIRALVYPAEAAALSFGIDPDAIELGFGLVAKYGLSENEARDVLAAHEKRAESIMRAQKAGTLGEVKSGAEATQVSSAAVCNWLKQCGVPVPKEWRPAGTIAAIGKWPWGDHETALLSVLAEAARNFWSNYDPDDPQIRNPPKNKDVVDFIKRQLVSRGLRKGDQANSMAKAMATIIRHDRAGTGRPKKREQI